MTLRISNWTKFQHYKNRRPPWIKLYCDHLNSPEWFDLTLEQQGLMTNLWMLAAEDPDCEGCLPDLKTLAFRLRMDAQTVASMISEIDSLNQWFDGDASKLLASCYQVAIPETERETEGEGENTPPPPSPGGESDGGKIYLPQDLDPENEKEPILTLVPEKKPEPAPKEKPLGDTDYTEAFEKFWSAYPRKVGKVAAFKTWRKQKLDSKTDLILVAIEWQLTDTNYLQKSDTQYIQHPVTWLNAKQYLDEQPTESDRLIADAWTPEQIPGII